MGKTKIDVATSVINPISGCLKCDENGFCPGQFKCYAEGYARRLAGKERKHPGSTGYQQPPNHFKPTFHLDKVQQIYNLSLTGRGRIFLDSMGDWFSEGVNPAWIYSVIREVDQQPGYIFAS